MGEFEKTGGAQIGWVNASWPLAKLFVSSNLFKVSVRFLGDYEFKPEEVVEIKPYRLIPIIASGIRVVHIKRDYPKQIIFWPIGSPAKLIEKIRATGFLPKAQPLIEGLPSGFPFKWTFAILVIAIWNVLLWADVRGDPRHHAPGIFTFVAVFSLFLTCLAVKNLPTFQRLVLRAGHSVGEVRPFLSLLQIISGLMSFIFGLFVLTGPHLH